MAYIMIGSRIETNFRCFISFLIFIMFEGSILKHSYADLMIKIVSAVVVL